MIANGRSIAQIEELIGADRLIYLDLHGLIRSVRHDNSEITNFDTSCFSGEYVTEGVTDAYLRALEQARSDGAKAQRHEHLKTPDLTFSDETADAETAVGM